MQEIEPGQGMSNQSRVPAVISRLFSTNETHIQ